MKLVEAFHLLLVLNSLPAKERRRIHKDLVRYKRLYKEEAKRAGYDPESPLNEEELNTEKLGLICGLGMNEVPCPFLSTEEGECKVYSARPSMCRLTFFEDAEVCRRDWENPIAFLWKNEIAPFIERVREAFNKRWELELERLKSEFPKVDVHTLERKLVFLPDHLRFDPVKGRFYLRGVCSP